MDNKGERIIKDYLIKFMEWQVEKKPQLYNFAQNSIANNFLNDTEVKVTHDELLNVGFKRNFIEDEPETEGERYIALFNEKVLGGGNYMYGNLIGDGCFRIHGIPYDITNINQIKVIINVLGLDLKEMKNERI